MPKSNVSIKGYVETLDHNVLFQTWLSGIIIVFVCGHVFPKVDLPNAKLTWPRHLNLLFSNGIMDILHEI